MNSQHFLIDSGPQLTYDIIIANGELILKFGLIKRTTTIPLSSIEKVEISKQFGGKVKVIITHSKDGNIKKCLPIIMDAINQNAKDFLVHLKKTGSHIQFENHFSKNTNNTKTTFKLSSKFFGKYFSRFALFLFWGFLSLTLFGLPIFLYLILTNAYTLRIDETGITIKKVMKKIISWNELANVEFSLLNVTQKAYGASIGKFQWGTFKFTDQNKKTYRCSMQIFEAIELAQILANKNLIPKSHLQDITYII